MPDGTIGVAYNVQLTENESFGMFPVTWGITAGSLPPGLTLDTATMSTVTTISGTPTTPGLYNFTVSAEYNSSANQCSTQNYTINIPNPVPFTITTTSLPSATVGTPYFAFLQTSGAQGTVTWSCSNAVNGNNCPSLPPGLMLNANSGVISGTPTTQGLYQFTAVASVTNPMPQQAMQQFAIIVASNTPPCTPTVSPDGSSPLPGGDIGINYPPITIAASGCPGPFSFSAVVSAGNQNALPPGLSLSSSGVLSGKPTTIGTFTFAVAITGPNNYENQIQYKLAINPLPTTTTASPLPKGPVGAAYSQQIAATGGTPPYTFSMDNNPPGITITPTGVLNGTPTKPGTFSFNIGVTDSLRGQTTSPFDVTFVTATTQIQVAPLSLTFNADFQGKPPATQAISVVPATGSTPPVNFSVSIDNGQSKTTAPSWITVSPTSATAPAGLVVSVDQGAMPAGSYPARIRLTDSSGLATDVAVTLNVASVASQLIVGPAALPIAARSVAPGNMVENLLVSNNGPGSISFTASVLGASPWIKSVTPSSGTTTRNAPVTLQVQLDTNGLQVGGYDAAIEVASSAGTIDVPVSLFVAASGPILGLDTSGVLFQPLHGGGSTATRNIEVLNLGDSNSTVKWEATLVGGSTWLNLVSSSGTATDTTPGTLTLGLAPNATQMTPGPYYSIVKVTDSNSLNSPQYITAVLNLEPGSSIPTPDVEPAGQFFTTTAGGAAPPAQQVQVNTSSASAVAFHVAILTADGGTWLKATPTTGNASGQTAGSVSVSVDPTGLAAGIYTGDVNISIGPSLQSVNVTFVVQPTGASSSIAQLRPKAAGCTASKLAITETALANNFAVPAGWPATLIVQLNDDCSAPVTGGNVVASFSNGDAALKLAGDSLGNYSATWQPGAVNAEMVVTINAAAGTLQPATAKLYGGIAQNLTPPPTLNPNGTVNNLNPVGGAPLTPGTIAAVYGTGLGSMPVSTGVLPLPNIFDNTFALVGPAQAPLYFLSSGQINLQIPNQVTATQQVPIVLSVNNALTIPVMLNIVPAAPGVASYSGGKLIAQHADFSLVTSASPAKPGETLVMYLVGMGATNPSVASGSPAPSSPLAKVTLQPTVTVDSQPANVVFAGLTPGSVGLYQIDFEVPSSARTGNLSVTVTQNGVPANSTTLPVLQ